MFRLVVDIIKISTQVPPLNLPQSGETSKHKANAIRPYDNMSVFNVSTKRAFCSLVAMVMRKNWLILGLLK